MLARFDALLRVVEWWEDDLPPHTAEVRLPLVTAPGLAPGGTRSTAAFADAIIREVGKAKPLREHLTVVQSILVEGAIGIEGIVRIAAFTRSSLAIAADTSPLWAGYLQTEDGEPLQDDADDFLDTAP